MDLREACVKLVLPSEEFDVWDQLREKIKSSCQWVPASASQLLTVFSEIIKADGALTRDQNQEFEAWRFMIPASVFSAPDIVGKS